MKRILCIVCFFFLCGNAMAQEKGFEKAIEINGGVGLDDCINYTFGANLIGGYRVNPTFFIGGGIGYTYLDGLYYKSYEYLGVGKSNSYDSIEARSNAQAFVRAKLNLTNSKVSPFLLVDLGGTFSLASSSIKMANGLIYEPAFGIDFKMNDNQGMYVMVGYKGSQYEYEYFNTTYGSAGNEIKKGNAGTFCLHLGFKF